jgi:signal transduction histidine kinase
VASILIGGLAYRKTIFTEKQRIAWIIVAYSLAGLSGLLAFNFSVVFGPIGVITSLSILAYAVFRYRLISARMAVSQRMAKSIAALSLVMVYILINEFMAQNLITQEPRAIYINALYMLCFFGLYNKLESNLRTYSDPLLVGYYYNLQDEKTAIVNRLSHCLDNRELKTTLDDIFYRLIKVKNYRIYLRHKQRNVFNRFDIENNLIDKEVPEQAFSQSREVTFYEEVGAEEKKAFIGLQQSAFVPILAQDKVIGIITLGQPLKKEQFALRDIQLLSWLGNRLGDVIQIVLKYNQCMDELSEARKTLSMISLFNAYNHDVKAPLNNISALVRAGDLLPTEEKEQLILEQTHLGLNRVNTMCNILSGSNNQSKQTVDLNQSIRNVHRLFEMNIKKTELRLESIPKLLARQDMVEILLSNLYKNAIEACSGKPVLLTIRTSYDKVKNTIVFMFADNGKGMHAHMVDTLFTQPITTKKDQGGSGVGMSVIKNIINELDGHMHIHSAVDRGTTFTFSIPPLMHMVEDSATVVSDVGETGLSKY